MLPYLAFLRTDQNRDLDAAAGIYSNAKCSDPAIKRLSNDESFAPE
jgi:hypothetical protein